MKDILRKLSVSKALEIDSLLSGAFKHAPLIMHVWLRVFINASILHQSIPYQVLPVITVIFLKSKCKAPTVCGTNRPIAIETTLSKIMERALLHWLQDYLLTADSQLSYKGHSTELCVWTIKHIIDYYTNEGVPVYLRFLDTSKAFDRVNYWKLFTKLHSPGCTRSPGEPACSVVYQTGVQGEVGQLSVQQLHFHQWYQAGQYFAIPFIQYVHG